MMFNRLVIFNITQPNFAIQESADVDSIINENISDSQSADLEESSSKNLLLEISIEVANNKKETIQVYSNDDIELLVSQFSVKHQLPDAIKLKLFNQIKEKLQENSNYSYDASANITDEEDYYNDIVNNEEVKKIDCESIINNVSKETPITVPSTSKKYNGNKSERKKIQIYEKCEVVNRLIDWNSNREMSIRRSRYEKLFDSVRQHSHSPTINKRFNIADLQEQFIGIQVHRKNQTLIFHP